jgi:hypothetical protein
MLRSIEMSIGDIGSTRSGSPQHHQIGQIVCH